MPHHAIIGATGCGKTVLASRILAPGLKRQPIKIGVLDPFGAEWPSADFQTTNPETFLAALPGLTRSGERWALFVDESSHALDRYDLRFDFLATGARQCGIVTYFLAQYPKQLSPAIRNSVPNWWLFNCDLSGMAKFKTLPELAQCPQLPAGGFFLVRPFTPTLRGQIHGLGTKKVSVDLKPVKRNNDRRVQHTS